MSKELCHGHVDMIVTGSRGGGRHIQLSVTAPLPPPPLPRPPQQFGNSLRRMSVRAFFLTKFSRGFYYSNNSPIDFIYRVK